MRLLPSPQTMLALAVALTVVLSFLPASWLRWTSDVGRVVSFPMTPFQDMGVVVAGWLKPPQGPAWTESEARLLEEKERFERLYNAEQIRAMELEFQLEQLQRIPLERRQAVRAILGRIVEQNPRTPGSVRINRGSIHGVRPGTVAVYGGVNLVGRVVEGVDALSSRVEPITSVELIDARILPRDAHERIERAPLVQLQAQRDGTFLVDSLARDQPVRPGDLAVLDDRRWPSSAQAMILGEIESVEPNDRDALRSIVIIRPRYHLRNLPMVTLYVEDDEDQESAR